MIGHECVWNQRTKKDDSRCASNGTRSEQNKNEATKSKISTFDSVLRDASLQYNSL